MPWILNNIKQCSFSFTTIPNKVTHSLWKHLILSDKNIECRINGVYSFFILHKYSKCIECWQSSHFFILTLQEFINSITARGFALNAFFPPFRHWTLKDFLQFIVQIINDDPCLYSLSCSAKVVWSLDRFFNVHK